MSINKMWIHECVSVQDKIKTLKSEQDELRGDQARRRFQVKVNIRFTWRYNARAAQQFYCTDWPVPRGSKKMGGTGSGLHRRNPLLHRSRLNRYQGLELLSDTTENKYGIAWITVIHVKVLPHYPGARQWQNHCLPTLGPLYDPNNRPKF